MTQHRAGDPAWILRCDGAVVGGWRACLQSERAPT
jgi:hypothetical protein